MTLESKDSDGGHVYRDSLEQHRGAYYVSYHPAQLTRPLAILNVVYPQGERPKSDVVKAAMEHELQVWVQRYPAPTMVMAFAGDDRLHVIDSETYLRGYAKADKLQQEWRRFDQGDDLLYLSAERLAQIYHDLPFRVPAEVRKRTHQRAARQGRSIRLIVLLMVGGPVLIELVALGWTWLGHVLAAVSLIGGFIKLSRAMGWMKPSAKQLEKDREEQRMRHHHYHCVRNPEGFESLKLANLQKELADEERARFERIKKASFTPSSN